MRNYYGNFGATRPVNNWREVLEQLQAAREHLKTYGDQMSPYEAGVIERDIKERSEQYRQMIAGGVLGEWNGAIENYQKTQSEVDRARAREIARWSPTELLSQMQVAKMRVDQALSAGNGSPLDRSPSAADRLKVIYTEALSSDNPTMKRATAEVFQVLPVSGDTELNHLVQQAKNDLRDLRSSEELAKAHEARAQAWDGLMSKHEEVRIVAQALGEPDPAGVFPVGEFGKALRRVAVDRDSGQVKIYKDSDPEVSGVMPVLETHGG